MENILIKEFKQPKPNAREPQRTRPYVEFQCGICNHVFTINKSAYSSTKPCVNCQKRLRGKENFFAAVKRKFGDAFNMTEAYDAYVDYTTPIPVTCTAHNCTYMIRPVHFVAASYDNAPHKGGCPECRKAIQLTKNRKGIEHYLRIISDKFPHIQVISHGTATTNLEQITLACPTHGKFTKTLAAIYSADPTKTNLCPHCSNEQHAWRTRMARTDIAGTVYFVKFLKENIYKCGVTYRTVKERLHGHISNTEIVWELPFDTLSDAYFFEYQFFRVFKHLKCKHPDPTLGGYTEFFNSLIQKPSKRFIEEILCRKESNSEELLPTTVEDNSERSPSQGTCND